MSIPRNSNIFSDDRLNITPTSSVNCFNSTDNDSFNFKPSSSFNRDVNALEESGNATASSKGYDSKSGYGLIDAAAAVAKSVGEKTFADVPNVGGNSWGADLVKAPEVWAKGYTGKDVVVAVVDTGVDYNHADLKNNIWTNTKEIAGNGKDDDGDGYVDDVQGWNFVDNNNNVMDNNSHGTHVSGTIAGEKNDFGVTGIAYDAKIMPVKVLDDSGSGYYSAIADGVKYAVNHGANVINLSLGSDYPNNTLESAIEYASSKGVIVVMAAGNSGDAAPGYPARYAQKSGIAVGAVDKNNNLAKFSNQAGKNTLAYVTAPGVDIYSTVPGNKYDTYSGTSMAAPHVAGVVALMLSANHNLTDAQVRQIVTETAENSTKGNNIGPSNPNLPSSNINLPFFGSIPGSTPNFGLPNFGNIPGMPNFGLPSFGNLPGGLGDSTIDHNQMFANRGVELQFTSYEQNISDNTEMGMLNKEKTRMEYQEYFDNMMFV